MRAVTLARTAADAEILLIRRELHSATRRAAFAAAGGVFAIGALILLHVLIYVALRGNFPWATPVIATVILLAIDAVIAGILLFMAKTGADPVAAEARALRDECLAELRRNAGQAVALRAAGRFLGHKSIYGVILAALTARYFGAGRRAPAPAK